MSAADSQWPAWLRRHTGVDHVPAPSVSFAWIAIALSFLVIAYVGGWNAAKYPITLGYDYNSNANYMHVVLTDHRIPTVSESLESRQPPVYYIVGGLAARAGHWAFGWHEEPTHDLPEHSYRGAQILNTGFVLLTALLLLSLARIAAPRRPVVWAASLAFFAFLPVVAKTEAMIHPEPMNMFLSTLAVWLAVRIARSERVSRRLVLLLLVVLGVGLATRASIIFTAAAIAIAFVWRFRRGVHVRRLRRQAIPLAAAVVLGTVAAYWITHGSHTGSLQSLIYPPNTPGPRRAFWALHLHQLFDAPFRTNFTNSAVSETYTEIWGDWIGSFAWSTFMGSPTGRILAVLKDQAVVGVIPTVMGVTGYGILAVTAARRRPDLLALTLVPPIALAGYFVRAYEGFSPDGDLLKASYVLTTAPIWALGFGIAFDRLGRYRLLRLGLGAALAVFAVMELRFMLYGVRDGHPPF